ncbi:MAG TPA: hypothetical protein VGN88_06465 [Phycisphaerae bacterium]|jgi:hypothetical protein
MFRWLIRIFFIALCVACVVAWVGSYWQGVVVQHQGAKRYALNVECGRVLAGCWNLSGSPAYWDARFYDPKGWTDWDAKMGSFLGFTLNGTSAAYGTQFSVTLPLWFLTAISALVLGFAWRKTKAKYNGKAFPIEQSAKAD